MENDERFFRVGSSQEAPRQGMQRLCRFDIKRQQSGERQEDVGGLVELHRIVQGAQANDVLETNSDGHAVIAVLTTVPGKTQGTLKVTAEGHNCLPSVLVPWSVPANAAPKTPEH